MSSDIHEEAAPSIIIAIGHKLIYFKVFLLLDADTYRNEVVGTIR